MRMTNTAHCFLLYEVLETLLIPFAESQQTSPSAGAWSSPGKCDFYTLGDREYKRIFTNFVNFVLQSKDNDRDHKEV